MNKDIINLINKIKKFFLQNWKIYFLINWRTFFIEKNEKKILIKYVNNDYIDLTINEFQLEKSDFVINIKKYLKNKWIEDLFLFINVDYEEWYFISIWINNTSPIFFSWSIMISWLLKYYIINWELNFKYNIIKEFLEKEWYKELTPEIWNVELDVVWETFMSYKDWQKKAKEIYKEDYIDDNTYFTEKMDLWLIQLDREKDFEEFCEQKYEWPYTVKHLLFWESFIWELK